MEMTFDARQFNIVELESIEAPLTDYQAGVAAGVLTGLGILGIVAVAAC